MIVAHNDIAFLKDTLLLTGLLAKQPRNRPPRMVFQLGVKKTHAQTGGDLGVVAAKGTPPSIHACVDRCERAEGQRGTHECLNDRELALGDCFLLQLFCSPGWRRIKWCSFGDTTEPLSEKRQQLRFWSNGPGPVELRAIEIFSSRVWPESSSGFLRKCWIVPRPGRLWSIARRHVVCLLLLCEWTWSFGGSREWGFNSAGKVWMAQYM